MVKAPFYKDLVSLRGKVDEIITFFKGLTGYYYIPKLS